MRDFMVVPYERSKESSQHTALLRIDMSFWLPFSPVPASFREDYDIS
jgi:hypothetical protein